MDKPTTPAPETLPTLGTPPTLATTPTTTPAHAPMALRPREAAKVLGIGARLLWSETNAGRIPHVRIGRAVVYPLDALREWLAAQAAKGVRR